MRSVQNGGAIGVAGLLALLAVLDVTIGLGPAGWTVGIACAVVANLALVVGMRYYGVDHLGPADYITLVRAILGQGVAVLLAESFTGVDHLPLIVGFASVALLLDAVDGQVARRTGTVSVLGGHFDMETDAFLILVLSIAAAPVYGVWVLLIGAARYLLLVAGWLRPWLRMQVPPRYWRKVVAAVQGIVLTVAVSQLLPYGVSLVALVVALALLAESFGRDVVWMSRRRRMASTLRPQPSGVGGRTVADG